MCPLANATHDTGAVKDPQVWQHWRLVLSMPTLAEARSRGSLTANLRLGLPFRLFPALRTVATVRHRTSALLPSQCVHTTANHGRLPRDILQQYARVLSPCIVAGGRSSVQIHLACTLSKQR